jgi:hypothetical protein
MSLKTGCPVAGQKKFQSSRSSWISYMAVNRIELTVARPISFVAISRAKEEDESLLAVDDVTGIKFLS